jgi:ribosome biogenesis GTPase
VANFGRQYLVELDAAEIIECVSRGKKREYACGDRVALTRTTSRQGVIEAADPRSTLFYRADAFRQKLIAANITQVIMVLAAIPSFDEELLNRLLVAAGHIKCEVLILLNKNDLAAETESAQKKLQLYSELGYRFLALSAKRDAGPLREFLKNQTSVLIGQSGMGKSALVNALIPDADAATREISTWLKSGRHTTTCTRLYHLDAMSHIMDTPGLKEFGLDFLTRGQIAEGFPEFAPYLGSCKFSDCWHAAEPGCAVLQAVKDGKISERRIKWLHRLRPHSKSLRPN